MDGRTGTPGDARIEDDRFLRGRGRFVGNLAADGALVAHFLRSPVANGRIARLDVAAARAAPGVHAVLTAADLAAAGVGPLPCVMSVVGRDGRPAIEPPRHALCATHVRHVGDPVALVVGETTAACLDAAEQIALTLDELPAVVDLAAAPGAPTIWPGAPHNIAFDWETGDAGEVAAALATAAHLVELPLVNNRIAVSPLEPRALVAAWDPTTGRYRLHIGSQGVHEQRRVLAQVLGVAPERLHVLTPDVGGAFGIKAMVYPETVACLVAARRLGRPVRWAATRSEAFLSDNHGRDHVTTVRLGLDGDGRILALGVDTLANLGAYVATTAPAMPTLVYSMVIGGPYAVPAVHVRVRGVFTNMPPVDAYRGAGVPESLYLLERALDVAARRLGCDRLELRRRNLVPAAAMPYTSAAGRTYDVGDFAATLERAATLADWTRFPARRAESAQRGLRRGIGVSCYVHCTGGYTHDSGLVRVAEDGSVSVVAGAMSAGQGHETTLRRLVAERLQIDPARVRVVEGDSDLLPTGAGTGGSSAMVVAAGTLAAASDAMLAQARGLAAQQLECGTGDLRYAAGAFTVAGTDMRVELGEIVRWAKAQPSLSAEVRRDPLCGLRRFEGEASTFPNGCHVCELEVDIETGAVRILAFVSVDDLGREMSPAIVDGQLHGGIAQGIGQALHEQVRYERASGQLLSGSFLDYTLPRAAHLPCFLLDRRSLASRNNPLGMKGAGEVGTIGAPPAVINALCDALGVAHLDMPATPERVWRAAQSVSR